MPAVRVRILLDLRGASADVADAVEAAGAHGITAHLREDRRHVQDDDVRRLRASIRTRLNLEMANAPEIVAFALKLRPDIVCIVPERREEVTTEGGLDVGKFTTSPPLPTYLLAFAVGPLDVVEAPAGAASVPLRLLEDYKGHLQSDGYRGYSASARRDGIIHVGCLDHARRKFIDAVKCGEV